jgi:hypothetical protein
MIWPRFVARELTAPADGVGWANGGREVPHLKVVAYMDRPTARSKDLGDLIDAFSRYEEESDRRLDLFDVSVDGALLQFEETGVLDRR